MADRRHSARAPLPQGPSHHVPFSLKPPRAIGCGAMAEGFSPKSVKDVPKDKFIEAYAAHLKANDKVCPSL